MHFSDFAMHFQEFQDFGLCYLTTTRGLDDCNLSASITNSNILNSQIRFTRFSRSCTVNDLSGTKIASQNRSDHGGCKRARNHSDAEIAGFFALAAAKKLLAASDFGVSLRIAGKSQRPRPQVAAAARFRGRSDHGTLRLVTKSMTVYFGSRKLNSQLPFAVGKGFALSALLTRFSVCNSPL